MIITRHHWRFRLANSAMVRTMDPATRGAMIEPTAKVILVARKLFMLQVRLPGTSDVVFLNELLVISPSAQEEVLVQ